MRRRADWEVNNKRIRRLWRDEGLRVPQRRRKKRLTGFRASFGPTPALLRQQIQGLTTPV